jgi:hypothetical protein
MEGKGREGNGREEESIPKPLPQLGNGFFFSPRLAEEAYSLTIMNIPTTPSQEAPIEM